MPRTRVGHVIGLPKEIVVAMLAVALTVVVAIDLTGSPHQPVAAAATVPRTTAPPATTTVPATVPTTTSTVPPTTTAPPPPAATSHAVAKAAPVRRAVVAPPVHVVARTSPSVPLGVYVGSGDPSGVASFAAATGTHPLYASDYLPTDEGWAGISDDSTVSWITSQWRGSGYTLVLGVPIIPTDASGNAQGTLAAGAAGQYDPYYVTLANSLVAGGAPNAVLRLGWEFTGNWYPWEVTNATDAANFAAYFRNIVTSMRSVPGQSFKFVWNPNAGSSFGDAYTPAQAYPGSAYVDYVGIDVYDEGWSTPPTPQNSWANQLAQSWGLDWLASFSAAEGRPMVIPEWGIGTTSDGHGMGDDPYFITQFASWIAQNDVAWTSYFDFDTSDATHDLLDGQFPSSLAAFRAAFG